tara:strand:+ start:144 stop:245 length:102 start_codon:yes stop_codon:yes gene_type:complete
MKYSNSQKLAYDIYLNGENLMLSGAGGTGKKLL